MEHPVRDDRGFIELHRASSRIYGYYTTMIPVSKTADCHSGTDTRSSRNAALVYNQIVFLNQPEFDVLILFFVF